MHKILPTALLCMLTACSETPKDDAYHSDSEVAIDSMKQELTVTPEEANAIAEQALQK